MTKAEMSKVLLEVYNIHGPRENNGRVVEPGKFAAMSDEEVNLWDFDGRFLMRRVAKAIVAGNGQVAP